VNRLHKLKAFRQETATASRTPLDTEKIESAKREYLSYVLTREIDILYRQAKENKWDTEKTVHASVSHLPYCRFAFEKANRFLLV